MAFSAQELSNIANAVIDFHHRGEVVQQSEQVRPLYDDLMKATKEFPGGKDYITKRVSGDYEVEIEGYEGDDEVSYGNPATIKQAQVKWYETHAGIKVTHSELKKEGISVTETTTGSSTSKHTDRELVALTGLLDDKMYQLKEGRMRSMAETFWRDGTQDAKVPPGILSFILETPTTGTTFGIDRAANSWWRNRASLALNVSTPGNLILVTKLQNEFRQLRRFASPKHKFYAGSDFMDAFEQELRSKGNFTLEGWAKTGTIDASVADLAFKGVKIQYEPLLDDLSKAKYGFVLDIGQNGIHIENMEGEMNKMHNPARPAEKYVLYRAVTDTWALVAWNLRTSGVYSIA